MRDFDLEHPDITRALRTGYPWRSDDFYGEPYDTSELYDPREDETVEEFYERSYGR